MPRLTSSSARANPRYLDTAMVDSTTPAHTIRPAVATDASELARLVTALGHPTTVSELVDRWGPWTTAGNTALVAVMPDGALAGVATLHQTVVLHRPEPVGRITALVVDASVRGQGIGRSLVAAAESLLANAGCGLLEITSNVRLTEAHCVLWSPRVRTDQLPLRQGAGAGRLTSGRQRLTNRPIDWRPDRKVRANKRMNLWRGPFRVPAR